MKPQYLARDLQVVIAQLEFTPSNDDATAKLAHSLFIGQVLESLAVPYLKTKDKLKTSYADKLEEPCEAFDLIVTTDITVTAKVTKPREAFDKDAFIKLLAEKYNIDAINLHNLASNCVKESKAPVSFTTAVKVDKT